MDVYTSREAQTTELVERQNPVVWGSSRGLLSPAELGRYEANGFMVRESLSRGGAKSGSDLRGGQSLCRLATWVGPPVRS